MVQLSPNPLIDNWRPNTIFVVVEWSDQHCGDDFVVHNALFPQVPQGIPFSFVVGAAEQKNVVTSLPVLVTSEIQRYLPRAKS